MRGPKPQPINERFWAKVQKGPRCWLWLGYCQAFMGRPGEGAGQFGVKLGGNWKTISAPRFAYELSFGPIPEGIEVCHSCDHPPCVRPSHFFLGTHADNMADMWAKGRGVLPPKSPRGDQSPTAKLSSSLVEALRHVAGSQREKARLFGISQTQVGRILRNESWAEDSRG